MKPLEKIVILSAERHLSDQDNYVKTLVLKKRLIQEGFVHKSVSGKYAGLLEQSFVVKIDDQKKEDLLFSIAQEFEQDSVLVLDSDRNAHLVYLQPKDQGRAENIGVFTAVSKEIAEQNQAYTYDPLTDTYFICLIA